MNRFRIVLLIVVLSLTLIQCGGEKADQPAAEASPATETTTPSETKEMAPSGETSMEYDLANGEAVYKKYCFACHDAGLAGAAKHTDTARWEESAAKGIPTLIKHVTEGYQGQYGMIPPKGTCMECSDQDITDAVHYQLKMGGSLD